MSAFSIPLQVNSPQPASPLSSVAALMGLRGQMSEIALRSAQAEQAKQNTAQLAAETAQKNRDVADQNHIQEIEKDPDSYAKILAGDLTPLAGKVSDKTIQTVRTNVNAALQNEATRTTEQLAQRNNAAKAIGANLGTALLTQRKPDGSLDVDKVNTLLPTFIQSHAAELKALGVDPATVPSSISDEDHLNVLASRMNALASMTEAAQGLKSKQAETAAKEAETRKAGVQADTEQFNLDLMKGAINGDEDSVIDTRFAGHPDIAAAAKAAYRDNLKAGVPAALKAVSDIYDARINRPAGAAATIAAETPGKIAQGKAMIPVEAARAGAEENARIPGRVAGAVAERKAIAATSPDAFVGIVDATPRNQAMNEADKIYKEFTDKLTSTQSLLDTIKAAQGGNKAAAGVIPIEQVRTVLRTGQINRNELAAVSSNAGSTMDRIEGWIKGHTEGQPIPPDILRDTASLATIQQTAAKRAFDAGKDRLKMRGVSVDKLPTPTITGTKIRARDPQGNLHEAEPGTALPPGWKLEP